MTTSNGTARFPTAHTTKIQNPRSRLSNKLRNDEKPLMTFMGIPSTRMGQIVASTGSDAVIIDCEHGHIGDDAMHNSVVAISGEGVSPIIRIRAPHADVIKRASDTGAHGIMVPMINTAQEARNVVTYAKLPPQGSRGQGSGYPGFAHGISVPEYTKTCNQTLLTCVQIETKQGVENVDEIAAVDGIDMLFIGPNDLAMSVSNYVPARGDEPEFVAAIDKIAAAARKHGKWVARSVNFGEQAKTALEVFDTVAITGDGKAIQNWYIGEIAAARK